MTPKLNTTFCFLQAETSKPNATAKQRLGELSVPAGVPLRRQAAQQRGGPGRPGRPGELGARGGGGGRRGGAAGAGPGRAAGGQEAAHLALPPPLAALVGLRHHVLRRAPGLRQRGRADQW